MWNQKHRNTSFLLFICLILTLTNIWNHHDEPPAHWETREQYGITFRHPKGFRFVDEAPFNETNSYWQGGIQGEPASGDLEIIGLIWLTNSSSSLEDAIKLVIKYSKEENPGLSVQNIREMEIKGKEAIYVNLDLFVDGLNVPGVLSAFRDSFDRIIFAYHLLYTGSYGYSKKIIKKITDNIEFSPPSNPRKYTSYWPTNGWRYASPEDFGMDPIILENMVDDISATPENIKVDSVIVIKNGYIVFEEYFNNYSKEQPHIIYSCTKSVVSTIFGIAYENNLIPDLDTQLIEIFPDKTIENIDEWKKSITLRDLLMMSAGFDARDSWLYEWENLDKLHESSDAVTYMLNLSMDFEPGTRFEYTNGVSHLLSCIITEKTNKSAAEYGRHHLFKPLGINLSEWGTDNLGRNWGYNRIYLTPQDMAKIGYLFLREGAWDGEQIISSNWVNEATKHRIDANLADGYGYQWWVGEDYYFALGYMGQFIFVFPDYDLIVVLTGGTPETFDYAIQLPRRYVLSSFG
jgi:CubicO group peptidase (beta-lactamase class C family)